MILAELVAWALRRRDRIKVAESSMEPTLLPSDYVLIDPRRKPVAGSVVVFNKPELTNSGACTGPKGADLAFGRSNPLLVKRVISVDKAEGRVWLTVGSDNAIEGVIDSRSFGPVEAGAVLGVVTINLSHPRIKIDQMQQQTARCR